MINLCLVVIATQFSETKKRETERMMQERKRYQSSSTLASNSEPGGCYSEILKYLAHLFRRGKRKVLKAYYRARGQNHRKIKPEFSLRNRRKKGTHRGVHHLYRHCHQRHHNYHYYFVNTDNHTAVRRDSSPQAPRASPEASDIDPISSPRRPNFLTIPSFNNSTHPSMESLNTLAFAAVEALSPSLFKSHTNSSSPNHLTTHVAISRTPSFSSGNNLPSLPGVLALTGAKNSALAASNTLNVDCDVNKLQPLTDKGK